MLGMRPSALFYKVAMELENIGELEDRHNFEI